MKKMLMLILLAVSVLAEAQIQTPSPSPAATVSTVIGLTDVKISYARPKMKGRKIFGTGGDFLVPNGQIWRTGANSGTIINFSDDVKVEGVDVKKGEYLLFSTPGATEWSIMLYSDLSIGGNTAKYDKAKEVAKFNVKPEKLTEKVETFTIGISDIAENNTNGKVQLSWENTSVKFSVAVDFDAKVMKDIEAKTKVSPAAYITAANYYLDNGKDLNKALEWINLGISTGNQSAFWNIYTKAKIQKALGDKKGAMATAQQSLDLAKKAEDDFGYIKQNEDLMKTLK